MVGLRSDQRDKLHRVRADKAYSCRADEACSFRTGKVYKLLSVVLAALLICALCVSCGRAGGNGSGNGDEKYRKYADMSAEEITASLTLEQKANQMVMAACYDLSPKQMRKNCYGSILSVAGELDYKEWRELIDEFQQAAIDSEAGIPYFYGNDQIHGVYACKGAVIFPHNIGLGAADDEELMYRIGCVTADEAMMCHELWNFAPVVAQSADPRWGRTYESYGSDPDLIIRLSTAFTKGVQDRGVAACAKHYLGDGNTVMGTGGDHLADSIIDRGDARLTDEEIADLLRVYKAQVDAGVKSIMLSHSSLNGVRMHENKEYIDILRNELGFDGMITGDWSSVTLTSGETYYDQVVNAVNAGVDILMEITDRDDARDLIIEAVRNGDISEARVDEAVRRIIQFKIDEGLFTDPFCEERTRDLPEPGCSEHRDVAEEAVEKSLVLVKNDNDVLPLKKGTRVYITGPAADNEAAQCGGWTTAWQGSPTQDVAGATSILEGLKEKAEEYGLTVITDEAEAGTADVVLLAVGEKAYAEWYGDAEDMDLCGDLGLEGNREAIDKVKALGKPTVCCIVAGRHVFIDKYAGGWDSIVMCYLPGSEAQGITDVLCGGADFTGKLPSPWYNSKEQIGTGKAWLDTGWGCTVQDALGGNNENR